MTGAGWVLAVLGAAVVLLFWTGIVMSFWERTVDICYGRPWGPRSLVASVILAPVVAVASWLVDLGPAEQWRAALVALGAPAVLLLAAAAALIWMWARGRFGDPNSIDARSRPEEQP